MRHLITLLLASCLFILPGWANAGDVSISLIRVQGKNISLYESPDVKSKVVDTVQAGQTVIPFFQKNEWIKIANPQTGEVGWTMKAALDQNIQSVIKATMPAVHRYEVIQKDSNGKVSKVYQVVEVANADKQPLSPRQAEELFKRIQQRQRSMQEAFNKLMAEMFQNSSDFFASPDQN